MMLKAIGAFFTLALLTMFIGQARAEDGKPMCVSTVFKLIGPNHQICVTPFEDPDIKGITCFISMPVKGGISGAIGLAEDSSDASIACRQTGNVSIDPKNFSKQSEVFTASRSVLFKKMHVVRWYDEASRTFIYLAYTDKLIEGSPKNSISVVPMYGRN